MSSIEEIAYHHTDKLGKMANVLSRFSCVRLCVILWSVACQTPLSMGFSRQEYWTGFLCLSPRGFPNPEIEPTFLMYPTLVTPGKTPRWLKGGGFKCVTKALMFFFKLINLFILLYSIVLVSPCIDLNLPWVYVCSPS